ncbi:glutamate receptor-interacting protein 1-like isoform X2 [Mizuhopecten yessoensis]|uniref:glutamate receptor-interacting protein 1-like isoform X2 n=1 Tax=Mizuhopecten yessoensis TaxID=6573 RepID=UPI000B45A390|nr:glutamate receptor-interacting protein 1-like isoform X2 [Mizuhopecten yessoensis]
MDRSKVVRWLDGVNSEKVKYRAAENGGHCANDLNDDNNGVTTVELLKRDGFGLGLIISGGVDKNLRAQISNLKPGGIAYRSDCLEIGDYILSVNGIKTVDMKHDEIISLLRNVGEQVLLEVEYQLPDNTISDSFAVSWKQSNITLEKEGQSFGFTLRGGYHEKQAKIRPLTVTHIRGGGPADREGSIKIGDRIVAINEYNVAHFTLSEVNMFVQQCGQEVTFTFEYDVSVMDAVKNALGALLVEIDKLPGVTLGIALTQASHQGRWCLCIDNMQPMSIADRCGALNIGDLILSIDGATVEHMSIAEATQLLRNSTEDVVKLEILPVRVVQQQNSRDILSKNGMFSNPVRNSHLAAASSFPAIPSSFSTPVGFGSKHPIASSMLSFPCGSGTLKMSGRKQAALVRGSKKPSSCMSISSATTSMMVSNQVCHSETLTVNLKGDYRGLGMIVTGNSDHTVLDDFPVVSCLQLGSVAERCGLLQEGDRVLSVNGKDTCDCSLEEVSRVLRQPKLSTELEVEFDITESVMPSSGTFVVKLPYPTGGVGITMSRAPKDKVNEQLIITGVQKGSVAYRCGSVQPGDKLLTINDIRTDNLSMEEAENTLQSWDDIVKLKLKREDPYTDDSGEECVTYTVELQRHGGPLGITISGTDNPADPIIISDIIEGGLAERTAAIHMGDRLLAINGTTTRARTLTDATQMLQTAGDRVNLRIARPAETSKTKNKKLQLPDRSTTPIASVDSAMESWDSSGPDVGSGTGAHALIVGKPLPKTKTSVSQSQDSANFATETIGNGCSEFNPSDSEWDNYSNGSHDNGSDDGDGSDWQISKAFKDYENQSEMLKQISASLQQRGTASLDRRKSSEQKSQLLKNFSHSTAKDFSSESELHHMSGRSKQGVKCRDNRLRTEAYQDHVKTIFSPTAVQLHKVKLVKETAIDDFGFGLSDGMYEKGVYISGVREGSLADKAGVKQFDRILQVNGHKTPDFDCCLTIPLITKAGNKLDLIICRNPIAKTKSPAVEGKGKDTKTVRDHNSVDCSQPYMNVSHLVKGFETPKSV